MIITISRQIGSRGEDIGRVMATRLELPYFDHEIIASAARVANVSIATIEQAERVPSLLTRMSEALGRYPAGLELAEATAGAPPPPLTSDSYRGFIEQVIQGLATGPGGVVVGHGAQAVLRHHRNALHILVTAPSEQRVATVAAAEGITREEARRRVRQVDHERGDYFQRYYQLKWLDPTLYDLTLNSARLRTGAAVDAIVHVARSRLVRAG